MNSSTDSKTTSNRGKRKTQDPCPGCSLHKNLCICAWIPSLTLQTKIVLVIHAKELRRTTNTGTLAVKALTNSQMFIRGKNLEALDLTPLLSEKYRTMLFYPSDKAIPLTPEFINLQDLPIQLIVPDGNWRQASKLQTRHLELKNIPRVMITKPNQAQHHLRKENSPEGMSTLQAIAEALGIIEGEFAREPLLKLYKKKLEHTLRGRGVLSESV